MKRLFIMLFVAAFTSVMHAQTNDIDTALNRLEQYVKGINVTEETTEAQIDSINAKYNQLADAYKAVRSNATDDQVQNYVRISTLFKKKVAPYYMQKTNDAIDETSKKIGKWMNRQYKKVKGAVEGIKEN